MKYGIREICEVVLRAKNTMAIGNKIFYKGEPVLYFDTLKTSSLEGSSSTVYATGGRGNARLLAWDGDKTTTFTMEDALISPEGLMILAGAGLLDASDTKPVVQHITETIAKADVTLAATGGGIQKISLSNIPKTDSTQDTIYVMLMKDGEIVSEPYVGTAAGAASKDISVAAINSGRTRDGEAVNYAIATSITGDMFDAVLVDYYTEKKAASGAQQIEISADSFGSNFYLEASTLFRNEDGLDIPAEFIIPNCKVQSNFTFTMAATGDPSTFTFTLDCFPDYTRWDPTHKVLAAIQVIPDAGLDAQYRTQTDAGDSIDDLTPAG